MRRSGLIAGMARTYTGNGGGHAKTRFFYGVKTVFRNASQHEHQAQFCLRNSIRQATAEVTTQST